MRHICLGLLALALTSTAAADTKYRGASVSFDFKQADLRDLVRILADTGRFNIVLVDVALVKLDMTVKNEPWDQVLDELMVRTKLEFQRTGSLYVVGQPTLIAELKKAKGKRTYKGATLDLDVNDVDASAAARLLATASNTPFELKPGAPRRANLRVKRVPADQASELVVLQTGGTLVDKPAALPKPGTACLAPTLALAKLKLGGIAAVGIKRWALFVDDKGVAYVATQGACIGVEKATIRDIGANFTTLVDGGADVPFKLYP